MLFRQVKTCRALQSFVLRSNAPAREALQAVLRDGIQSCICRGRDRDAIANEIVTNLAAGW